MSKIVVGILGATAYTGIELVKHLIKHPSVKIGFLSSKSYAGKKFSDVFGELKNICDDTLISPRQALENLSDKKNVDCIFSCLPHAVSADLCIPYIKMGIRIIDLSADFRINDAEVYQKWYDHKHPDRDLLTQSVFGLPEHNRSQIQSSKIIANPGCYPTSILLPLLPLLKHPDVEIRGVIADSKSGVSGAGRSLKLLSHYPEANENFSAYSIGRTHRHIAEIEQELSIAAGRKIEITFSPHLLPVNRGILSTIYVTINKSANQCHEIVKTFYEKEPFIRVREKTDLPKLSSVIRTNYCDIAFSGGENSQPVIIISAIDNLLKGASGQAIQNMNIMFGIAETEGLI